MAPELLENPERRAHQATHRRRTTIMDESTLIRPSNLQLYESKASINRIFQSDIPPQPPQTPNDWFGRRFPQQADIYGSPFLELKTPIFIESFNFDQIAALSLNYDFFAAILGGEKSLKHHVVYYEPEMEFYFYDPADQLYKTTTSEKLQNQIRALLMKCAQEMPALVHKYNLVHEFRQDKHTRAIVNRAKSILAADQSFFSSTSPHQRIKGPELHERLLRVMVETMLEPCQDSILTVTQAYAMFCKLANDRQLGPLKRSMFKVTMRELISQQFGLGLRRDVPDAQNKQQEAWKGVKLLNCETLAA